MIINSVEIENFRGVMGKKNFIFEDRNFILLSASNGKGKTTVIDAIEWCLTGDIGRLSSSYNDRSPNTDERKKNVDGILKNKNSPDNILVSVIIKVEFEGSEYCIQRTQKKDILDKNESKVIVNGKEKNANEFLMQFVDKNFYNFYFCDIQKSFNLLSKKRSDLPELFTEFISDYSKEEVIVKNLAIFQEDIERTIDELKLKKIADTTISSYLDNLEKHSKAPDLVLYNKEKIYESEQIECSEMNLDEMSEQLNVLYKCGYHRVSSILQEVNLNENNKYFIVQLNLIRDILTKNIENINEAVKVGFQIDFSKIQTIESEINKLKEIKLNSSNIYSYVKILINLENPKFSQDLYDEQKKAIDQFTKEIEVVDKEIEILAKGNIILDSLSTLISKKDGIIEYRKQRHMNAEKANCPLCGSDVFNELGEENIFKIVNDYLGEHNQLLVDKKSRQEILTNEKNSKYECLLNIGNQVVKEQIVNLERKHLELINLKKETEDFFVKVAEISKASSNKYKIQNLCSENFLTEEIDLLQNKIESEELTDRKRDEYRKILTLLGYNYDENESEKTTYTRVASLAKECPIIIKFSIDIVTEKINSLKSLISNNEYLTTQKQLNESLKNNKIISNEIEKLEKLKEKSNEHAEKITNLVIALKKNEYENVGPFLHKFYRKLSRIESIKDISVVNEGNKISLNDEKDKNILNVLSNGQLSVFMLSYFLGGAVSRNQTDKFKIYFIDDLTACMDDINMLAFIDFLKYLLLEKNGFMEQIFFVTCDDRVRRLIQYKMNGGGIEYTELGEDAFA